MKLCLLSGNLIKTQLLWTNDKKTKAINVIDYLNGVYPKLKQYTFLLSTQSSEYWSLEEISIDQFKTIIGLFLASKTIGRY